MMIETCSDIWLVVLVSWLAVLPALLILWVTYNMLKRATALSDKIYRKEMGILVDELEEK
jgi:predicted tellurium resistance membrane protein TerC